MPNYDHDAIRKAYPDATRIDDDLGVFKVDGTEITIVQSDVDAARTTLNTEAAAVLYQSQRKGEIDGVTDTTYASIGDQLDMLFKAIDADSDLKTKFATWHAHVTAVKAKYPKPS